MFELPSDFNSIIDNPLEWQKDIDSHGLGVNLRGLTRFWNTVSHYGLQVIYMSGTPEFREIAIRIDDKYALVLWPDKGMDAFIENDTNIEDQYFHCKIVETFVPEKDWQEPYDLTNEVNIPINYAIQALNIITSILSKFSVITFKLSDNIGLQLEVTTSSPYIKFRFINISSINKVD